MKIYNYDPRDCSYICESIADADPMIDGGWLIPAYATDVAVGADKPFFKQIFDPATQSWSYVVDESTRPSPAHNWDAKKSEWVLDQTKQAAIDAQAKAAADAQAAAEAQALKAQALATIVVTTQSGKTFDGNEVARGRMADALYAAEKTGQTETTWILADNTPAVVTVDELAEARVLSIQRVGQIVAGA